MSLEASPFEKQFEKPECPIRITCVFGFDSEEVQRQAKTLIANFNWKYHSVAVLRTMDTTVTSIILWNTK